MRIVFVSNYINHHQIPLCNALQSAADTQFTFVQTEPMDEERRRMGWADKGGSLSFVRSLQDDPEGAGKLLLSCDILLAGWAPAVEETVRERLLAGRPVLRISERLYRDGRWKAISPRGLADKYRAFTRFRSAPCYLLCSGAYVGSDFALIHAFPHKKLRWGYFPPLRTYKDGELQQIKNSAESETGCVRLLWAGRFMDVKHPEMALRLAKDLHKKKVRFHLDMIGSGEKEAEYRSFVKDNGLSESVVFHGFMDPAQVRGYMEKARIFLFTSDHGEGWGAVLNEAMNSGCAVTAGAQAGGVPYLIKSGVNGYIYNGEDFTDFSAKVLHLIENKDFAQEMGARAYDGIAGLWNAQTAAERLLVFCRKIMSGEDPMEGLPAEGPLSPDPGLRPFLRVKKLP
jgi:glycosyltransferase involved in cell wall biosynthesis